MNKLIIPIFLLIVSGALSFFYSAGLIREVNDLRDKKQEIDDALAKGAELQKVKSEKLSAYNDIDPENRNKINKLLPDNIDSVQLIIDINEIASRRGLSIKNISVDVGDANQQTIGSDNRDFGVAKLSFSVSASYDLFNLFLTDLEDSLRLIDLTSLSFSASDRDLYEYQMEIQTYWLK